MMIGTNETHQECLKHLAKLEQEKKERQQANQVRKV